MKTVLLALWFALAAAPLAFAADATLKAGSFDPPRSAPEFSLAGSDGTALTLARYRGKTVLLSFGYTSCTAVCPVTLATLARARKLLGADAAQVQVVYITVDPQRDNPQRMRKFLATFDPTFIGGSGSDKELAAVRTQYGVSATRINLPDGDYSYSHSSFTYLIDRDGRIRALMPFGHSADDFAHDLRVLLKP
ncbi:MAG TPA: SCO family protein [Steroidobacteraceae bacterium]|nr:SCO family protein [Steroidobacteraceae bacterium]